MVRTGILLFLLGDTSFDLHTMLPFVCPEDFINWCTISLEMRSPLNEDMIVLDAVFTHFQNPKMATRVVSLCVLLCRRQKPRRPSHAYVISRLYHPFKICPWWCSHTDDGVSRPT
jgi:hypothetical protein